jgi:very-short-patch-repair endonuclease
VPRYADEDPPLPAIFSTAQATASGLTPDQVRHRVRSGRWSRISRGYYRRTDDVVTSALSDYALRRVEHVQRAVAAARRNHGSVIAMESAAIVHGLPLFHKSPDEVCLIVPEGRWAGRRHGARFVRARLAPDEVVVLGTAVTTPTRTWLDLARSRPLADALSAGDRGLRLGMFDQARLRESLDAIGTVRGCRRARFALSHLDALRETALESGSWAYFLEHALPLPRMQVPVAGRDRVLVGRVDFLWESHRLIGECDGRVKYASADVLYAEKEREDRLRDLGYGMVRWGWRDLAGGQLAARLRRALGH